MKFAERSFIACVGIFMSVLLLVSARGSTIRDDQPDSGYLDLGASADYAPVGSFVNSWGYTGSGTLIASDWVLTAGHMLDAATAGTFTISGTAYTSSAIFKNPGWKSGSPFGGNDFGLVHLSSPVSGVTPAKLYTSSSETGQVGTFVGFGATGTGLTGWQTVDNQKRAFQNMIDGNFGNPSILLASDFDNPNNPADNGFGSAVPLPLEGCVAPGDSGGGVFITEDSQIYLAGVISFVANADASANSDYGDASGFGRVSAYMPWIMATVPEPSTPMLLASSGFALLFWRRRKNK